MFYNYFRITLIRFCSFFYSRKRSKVIFYHDLHFDNVYTNMSTPISLFKLHVEIIRKSGYEIVSKITKKHGQIEISFDDGFLGIYENINTIIELGVPIKIFIVTSYIGKDNYINESQLLSLNSNPLVSIGSHTHLHSDLTTYRNVNMLEELEKSKLILESILGSSIDSLAFPYGRFNNSVINNATSIGYKLQYCSLPGFYYDEFTTNVKKRSLVQFSNKQEFKAILNGGDHLLYFWYFIKHYRL